MWPHWPPRVTGLCIPANVALLGCSETPVLSALPRPSQPDRIAWNLGSVRNSKCLGQCHGPTQGPEVHSSAWALLSEPSLNIEL